MTIQAQTSIDLGAVKRRQQATWSSGDYGVIGTTLSLTGELLCEAVNLRPGQSVLDVAAGNGNASLAAARRWANVTSTDYVPALLELGRARAVGERLQMSFQEADAEQLPFADGAFDVVLSVFGVMFTPDQEQAAGELVRVCRPGGVIGLASWTPESFIGHVFRTIGAYIPLRSADQAVLQAMLGLLSVQTRQLRYGSPVPFEGVRAVAEAERLLQRQALEVVLAAVVSKGGRDMVLGVAELRCHHAGMAGAEVGIVIRDDWQSRGVGSALLRELCVRAAALGLASLRFVLLEPNHRLRRLVAAIGPYRMKHIGGGTLELTLQLPGR